MAARMMRRCGSPGAIFLVEPPWQMCVMVGRCRRTDGLWHKRIYHRRGRRNDGLAGDMICPIMKG